MAQKAAASKAEGTIARAVSGRNVGNYDPLRSKRNPSYDVHVPAKRSASKRDEFLEVKYKHKGEKNALSIHADALLRKADHAAEVPKAGYHTVLIDVRDRSHGGAERQHYQGHDLYYKRGTGEHYSTANMYRAKNLAELKRLMVTPYHQLPAKARGTMPKRTKELEERAKKVKESRGRRDAGGKKEARRQRWRDRKNQGAAV